MESERISNIRDNDKRGNVLNFLKDTINGNYFQENKSKSKLKIVSAYFTIYAFYALREELKNKVSETKFILGEPSSIENLGLQHKRFKTFKIQDENIKLTNILKQNNIAKECYDWLKTSSVEIRTAPKKDNKKTLIHGKMYHIEQSNNDKVVDAIIGSSNFTTNGLGIGNCSNFELNTIIDSKNTINDLKDWFENLWENNTEDAKKEILRYLESLYRENSPEEVYYKTLYHLFEERLNEPELEDVEKNQKFIETKIWKMLYKFQKDAVKSIVERLNKYNGCILADSVGLGKTFTALAVIQYFICKRKPKILVLAPARLENNWVQYTENHIKNIFKEDNLRITLKFHTDLTAEVRNKNFDWGDFDLVVIDESHNFRNATASKKDENGNIIKISRYDKLMKDIIKEGARQPKILLLSATPVNTDLGDLRNQLRLIALDDDAAFAENLGIPSLLGITKTASKNYLEWANKKDRDKNDLLNNLQPLFFKLLDELTIARSRKQIKTIYEKTESAKDLSLSFPKRQKTRKKYRPIDLLGQFPSFSQLNDKILEYQLALFKPSKYIKSPDLMKKYESNKNKSHMSQQDRENYLIGMMKAGFLKRLESSIASFTISMDNTIKKIDAIIDKIDQFNRCKEELTINTTDENTIELEDDDSLKDFAVGSKIEYKLTDLNVDEWKKELLEDRQLINKIYERAKVITPERDAKLAELKDIIVEKSKQKNKKLLIFTTYSDTALYLFNNLKDFVKNNLGLNIAVLTGGEQISTYGVNKFNDILENFSPKSKLGKDDLSAEEQIDILIGTDCISEGQNLQDCDEVINYDIHWNPVRLIQRFGRIDRIGSKNEYIRMTCFWPTDDLDEYIRLRSRVEARMTLADVCAVADDNLLEDEKEREIALNNDLTYREKQTKRILLESEDSEDDFYETQQDIAMSDFTLEDFRADLNSFIKNNQDSFANLPIGINAITPSVDGTSPAGIIFCLKQKMLSNDNKKLNKLQPYYLLYVKENGEMYYTYENARKILDIYKKLCLGKNKPFDDLCKKFNDRIATEEGIEFYNKLLKASIQGAKDTYQLDLIRGIGRTRGVSIPSLDEQIDSEEDFDLITWLIVNGEK